MYLPEQTGLEHAMRQASAFAPLRTWGRDQPFPEAKGAGNSYMLHAQSCLWALMPTVLLGGDCFNRHMFGVYCNQKKTSPCAVGVVWAKLSPHV